jgi:IQ calmodulin-binding motif
MEIHEDQKQSKSFNLTISYKGKTLKPSLNSHTKKNFVSLIKHKQSLLRAQIVKKNQASFNLRTCIKYNSILKNQIALKNSQNLLEHKSAIYIQKIFRGFLSRKKFLQLEVSIRKNAMQKAVSTLASSVYHIFMNSRSTKEVIIS